jgi:pantothenate kinase
MNTPLLEDDLLADYTTRNYTTQGKDFMDFLLPFLAGAATASFIFFVIQMRKQLSSLAAALDDENISWIEPWYQTVEDLKSRIELFEEDLRSRIGELPKSPLHHAAARGHWPWETIRQRLVRSMSSRQAADFQTRQEDDDDDDEKENVADDTETETDPGESARATAEKKGFCIGSIFGLDVGGTLGKLVYFEQRPPDYDPLSLRERHYSAAASAREVLMARRAEDDNSAGSSSGATHSGDKSGGPRIRRRRSFSLGQMGWAKELEQEQQQRLQQAQKQQHRHSSQPQLSGTHSHQHESKHPVHSDASNEDLKRMYHLRQESVPDDLEQYIASVQKVAGSVILPTTITFAPGDENESNENQDSKDGSLDKATISSPMKKARSMFDFSKLRDRAEALDRFYSFARRLDSYDKGVKDNELSFFSRELGGDFHFIRFETRYMQNAMDLIRINNLHLNICEMGATGGGAHKYAAAWERQLGIRMDKTDELESLVAGMQFVLSTVVGECYTYIPPNNQTKLNLQKQASSSAATDASSVATPNISNGLEGKQQPLEVPGSNSDCSSDLNVGAPMMDASESEEDIESESPAEAEAAPSPAPPVSPSPKLKLDSSDQWWLSKKVQRDSVSYSSTYPYLLISIGTGVSILRVDGPRKHERVSGSSIGGGTYWGLMRLLTDAEDFDDVLELAEQGDPSKVDMMVGDIYGKNSGALEKIGLPSNVVASSFGKLVAKEDPAKGVRQEDLARALLLMVTNNIGQVGYLNAKLHKTSRIYFVGNFLRGNNISQKRLSYAISYWSKGEMEALFLEHEGYFGALGSFLLSQNISHGDQGFFQWDSRPPASPSDSGGAAAAAGSAKGGPTTSSGTAAGSPDASGTFHRRCTTFGE